MRVAMRADASLAIGSGHVMRCATLGQALRKAGHRVQMICRDLPGHMMDRLAGMDLATTALPAPTAPFQPAKDDPPYASWAMVPWDLDARQTRAAMDPGTDWLIVDHYAFDRRWQAACAGAGRVALRVMVIDDLFDRPHACDLLLDQNLGRSTRDYQGLLAPGTQTMIGPSYALLRPDFAQARTSALQARAARTPALRSLLIAMGGVDAQDCTSALLRALARDPPPGLAHVTVVLGAQAPGLGAAREALTTLPCDSDLRVDTADMASLMATADVAVGGAGGTALERCCLGLPTLIVVMAENQARAADLLASAGVARTLADVSNLTQATPETFDLQTAFAAMTPARLRAMQEACASVTDGHGTARVLAALEVSHAP